MSKHRADSGPSQSHSFFSLDVSRSRRERNIRDCFGLKKPKGTGKGGPLGCGGREAVTGPPGHLGESALVLVASGPDGIKVQAPGFGNRATALEDSSLLPVRKGEGATAV